MLGIKPKDQKMSNILVRQPSMKKCTQEIKSSRKPKAIKSIRIIDNQEGQNSHIKSNRKTENNNNNFRSIHQQFSFKKQYDVRQANVQSQKSNEDNTNLNEKINDQQQQLRNLQRMLASMRRKIKQQQHQYNCISEYYERFVQQKAINSTLKKQIIDLKALMKDLLLKQSEHEQKIEIFQ